MATLKDIVIGVMIFSMFVAGSSILAVNFVDPYRPENITSYNDTFYMTGIEEDVEEISEIIQTEETSFTDYAGAWKIPWNAMVITFKSLVIVPSKINQTESFFNLPSPYISWFIGGVISIFLIVVAFLVVGALLRKGGSL